MQCGEARIVSDVVVREAGPANRGQAIRGGRPAHTEHVAAELAAPRELGETIREARYLRDQAQTEAPLVGELPDRPDVAEELRDPIGRGVDRDLDMSRRGLVQEPDFALQVVARLPAELLFQVALEVAGERHLPRLELVDAHVIAAAALHR